MHDVDLHAFIAVFRGLLDIFPKRLDESEIGALSKAYFHALRRFTIPQLQAGADAWVQRGKFFPKPAEWRESIPREAAQSVTLTALSPADAAEYLDAERRNYEGDPCTCGPCRSAGVNHRFLRYVPESNGDGIDAKGLIGERVVVRGHWAHGVALAEWYEVKERFWVDYAALIKRMTMPKVNAPLVDEPEPVEESA